ncbi:zinc-binding dehydrogenase [Lacticaseibacillus saniviri]|uniref:zinc-binding dehydrogenase n=1 Tax=Lacticaseibacillus saniviri TaxID=931533 RepID=UPI001EDFBF8E|nr:zinc-binding dehydrogenase [Lacticaseibacillus saniviri]MCG4281143.1 zinc-binding dehydrogenase [Lacticaseibacillus saniviri]
MKAAVVHTSGDSSHLVLEDIPTPAVKPGWSLIKVKGFGINRAEIITRNGGSPTVKFPRVIGIEAVGEIVETTDSVRLPVGQTVVTVQGGMGREYDGSYAEYVLTHNENIYPVTTQLSWPELAAVPETFLTAYGSLLNLKLAAHDKLLIRGGTSGVGVAAAKLAKAMQPTVKVFATTRNLQKADQLRAVGVDTVIEDQSGELATDETVDKVLEMTGADSLVDSLSYLNRGGILCLTGALDGVWTIPDFDPFGGVPSGRYLTTFSSGVDITSQTVSELFKLIDDHQIDVKPAKVFNLDQVGEAQDALDQHDSFGKVVVMTEE